VHREHDPPEKAKEILDYFVRNPEAADTLEGVARWRLMEERVHRNVEEVNQVLGWLVAEGFLLREFAKGADPIFSLNRARAAEAKGFLVDTGHRRGGDKAGIK